MTRRPFLWLLVVLALAGGWLAYDRGRVATGPTASRPAPATDGQAQAPTPAVEPERADARPAAPATSPVAAQPASDPPVRGEPAEASAGSDRAADPTAASDPASAPAVTRERAEAPGSQRPASERPAAHVDDPSALPGAAAEAPAAREAPAAGRAAPVEKAAEAGREPPAAAVPRAQAAAEAPATGQSSAGQPGPQDRAGAAPDNVAEREAPAPASDPRPLEWSRLEAIAPGAGPDDPPPSTAGLPKQPNDPATTTPTAEVPSELSPGGEEQRQAALETGPPPEAGEAPSTAGPTEAVDQPERAAARAGPPDEPPAPSLMVDSIRRALAAILGGAREPGAEAVDPSDTGRQAARLPATSGPEAGAAAPVPPSFDIVRVERDGRAVLAGRAAPGAEVELRSGDKVLDRVRASSRGEWVATPLEPLPAGGGELMLVARNGEGAPLLEAEQVVVVALPEPPPPQPAEVAMAGPPPPQPAEVARAGADPVAVLLPKDEQGQGRVLQAPGRISSDGQLALLVLDYDHAGQIRLTGEAPPGAPVRIYVDNEPSGEVVVAPSGKWSKVLDRQLAPGNYTLRLDQLGSEGRPIARLETPFTRVRQPPVAGQAQIDYVIVQPGNSLWRIARRLFGEGFKYVHIYDANQAQIRDPDLIYPGQVFEVPAALGTAG